MTTQAGYLCKHPEMSGVEAEKFAIVLARKRLSSECHTPPPGASCHLDVEQIPANVSLQKLRALRFAFEIASATSVVANRMGQVVAIIPTYSSRSIESLELLATEFQKHADIIESGIASTLNLFYFERLRGYLCKLATMNCAVSPLALDLLINFYTRSQPTYGARAAVLPFVPNALPPAAAPAVPAAPMPQAA